MNSRFHMFVRFRRLASKWRLLLPSVISVARVFLAFELVLRAAKEWPLSILLLGVGVVIGMDALDGVVARYTNSSTLFGSFVDILADRFVEFVFFYYFIQLDLIPLWFVWVFYARIVLTDICRLHAFSVSLVSTQGISLPARWRGLVLSPMSRSLYGVMKGILFCGLFLVSVRPESIFGLASTTLLIAVVIFSLFRAAPILTTYVPELMRRVTHREALASNVLRKHTRFSPTRVMGSCQVGFDVVLGTILLLAPLMK